VIHKNLFFAGDENFVIKINPTDYIITSLLKPAVHPVASSELVKYLQVLNLLKWASWRNKALIKSTSLNKNICLPVKKGERRQGRMRGCSQI